MRARYLIVCLLAGLAVCATVGAVTGGASVLLAGRDGVDQPGPLIGVAFGALLGGLIIGAAIGAVLGGLSGVVATLLAGGTRDPGAAALRVGLAVLLTYAVALGLLCGLTGGSALGGDLGWALPQGGRWLGVLVPSVLGALVSAWAARSVADLEA